MLYLDADGMVTWADTDAAEALCCPVEELVGRPIDGLLTGDEASLRQLEELLHATAPGGVCELQGWRAIGGWIHLRAEISDHTHPAFGGFRVALFDVTGERAVEGARDLMFDAVAEPMWVVDPSGDVLLANPAASRRLALSPEAFAGPVPPEVVDRLRDIAGEPLAWLAQPVEFCLLSGVAEVEQAVAYAHRSGRTEWYTAHMVLRSFDGAPRAVVRLTAAAAPTASPSDEKNFGDSAS